MSTKFVFVVMCNFLLLKTANLNIIIMVACPLLIYFIIWFGNFCGVQIFMDLVGSFYHEQVDIIISKNQELQIYLKAS